MPPSQRPQKSHFRQASAHLHIAAKHAGLALSGGTSDELYSALTSTQSEVLAATGSLTKAALDAGETVRRRVGQEQERMYAAVAHYKGRALAVCADTAESACELYLQALEAGSRRLLHFEELPVEWQENEHILTGYRFLSSYTQCLHSIFQVHNETGNIWTHLLGALFFLGLAIYHHRHLLPSLDASLLDHTIFLIFFAAVAKCLICSVMYHTFTCHTHLPTMKCAATLDYMGISLLITASILVVEYYGFYCQDGPRNAYMLATAGMGIAGVILPWFPWFDEREYRGVRISVFLLMGAAGIFPILHAGLARGLFPTLHFLYPLIFSVLAYVAGVYFFVQKFPERKFPGWFDHLGNSHQLWHIFVVAGIWGHYVASKHFFAHRFTYGCLA